MRVAVTLAAAALSGVLLWLASPSVGLGWLAWVALVPVAAAALAGSRLAVPLAYTVYLELLLLPALPFGLADDQWADPIVPVLVAGSPVVVAAVAVALFGALLYAIRFPFLGVRPDGVRAVLIPALAWTALDLLRVKFDPSGLWGALFLSQAETPAARAAGLVGPWLLTFLIVATAFAGALAALRRDVRPAAGLAAAVAVVTVASVGLPNAGNGTLAVAAVQPGYDTAEFDLPVLHYLRKRYRNHELATRDLIGDLTPLTRAAAAQGADIVVWPEATAWVDPRATPSTRALLTRLARETGAALVVPYFFRERGEGAAVVVLPDGRITVPQPKQRPMWFVDEHPGPLEPARPVAVGPLTVGTLLGVDNQDPAASRRLVAADADVLTASTHDWQDLAEQQRAFSRLHAVALGVPLVRADWRFGSAVYAPDGSVVADAPPGKRRTVVVATAPSPAARPYAWVGDAFGWAALAGALAFALAAVQTPKERRLTAPRARLPRLSSRRS
jgi:apolipoprotein N-acyltransferase